MSFESTHTVWQQVLCDAEATPLTFPCDIPTQFDASDEDMAESSPTGRTRSRLEKGTVYLGCGCSALLWPKNPSPGRSGPIWSWWDWLSISSIREQGCTCVWPPTAPTGINARMLRQPAHHNRASALLQMGCQTWRWLRRFASLVPWAQHVWGVRLQLSRFNPDRPERCFTDTRQSALGVRWNHSTTQCQTSISYYNVRHHKFVHPAIWAQTSCCYGFCIATLDNKSATVPLQVFGLTNTHEDDYIIMKQHRHLWNSLQCNGPIIRWYLGSVRKMVHFGRLPGA